MMLIIITVEPSAGANMIMSVKYGIQVCMLCDKQLPLLFVNPKPKTRVRQCSGSMS